MKVSMRGLENSNLKRSEDAKVVLHVDGVVPSRAEARSLTSTRRRMDEDAYSSFDASLKYMFSDNLSVSLWGKNLNVKVTRYDTNFSAFGQIKNKFLLAPRTYGVSARYDF
jgi:outer membrane receptor protein involved in Fe transport